MGPDRRYLKTGTSVGFHSSSSALLQTPAADSCCFRRTREAAVGGFCFCRCAAGSGVTQMSREATDISHAEHGQPTAPPRHAPLFPSPAPTLGCKNGERGGGAAGIPDVSRPRGSDAQVFQPPPSPLADLNQQQSPVSFLRTSPPPSASAAPGLTSPRTRKKEIIRAT